MDNRRFVVIGGDAAGMSAASLAKRKLPDLEIEAYEMGDYTSYGACGMPYYVAGVVTDLDDLVVVTPEEFEHERGIKVFMRHRAERIIPGRKVIEVLDLKADTRKEVSYDQLLIATGAEPVVPSGVDTDLDGVFTLRSLPDVQGIKQHLNEKPNKDGLVIGTGYIGMEMAEALFQAGLRVSVLGRRPRVMGIYEEEVSQTVAEELAKHDIPVTFGAAITGIERKPAGRLEVHLDNGETITTDLVVVGAGVRPRSGLAKEAGLELGAHEAIKVDRFQKTSNEDIWSAGDCAEAYHVLLEKNAYVPLALTANRAGRIVANNVVGIETEFPGILGTAICKVLDLTVARTGLGFEEARDAGHDVVKVTVTSRSRPHYYPGSAPIKTVLIVERGSQRLWGAQMVGVDGVAHRINTFAAALGMGLTLKQIHGLDLAYAPPFSPVWDPVLISCEVAMKKVK